MNTLHIVVIDNSSNSSNTELYVIWAPSVSLNDLTFVSGTVVLFFALSDVFSAVSGI